MPWKSKGEAQKAAVKEYCLEISKVWEGTLGEKDYFGGHSFGFTDIVVPLTSWFYGYEQYGGFKGGG